MALNLQQLMVRVDDLPTLPETFLRITQIVNNPRASAKDLAAVIGDDQVLTARLLRLVNSSFYGFPQKVSTVTGAIVLLGFDAIRSLLLSSSVFEIFPGKRRKNQHELAALWDHALGCAVAAKVIGGRLRYDNIEELFVGGLLHDIGKIVEMVYLPGDFNKVRNLVKEKDLLILEAEREVLGVSHAEVGTLLASQWRLPQKLVKVIETHHSPEEAANFGKEASVVHLADILCRALELGSGGDPLVPPLSSFSWTTLGLEQGVLASIMEETAAGYKDMRSVLIPGR
jgi:putative nucleotidyltransferase with HDIG domain